MNGWVCGLLAAALVADRPAAPPTVTIGSFEVAGTWELGLGGEFPGARGRFELDPVAPHGGRSSARLTGDFSGGGAYVAILRAIQPALTMTKVSFWARSNDCGTVVLRLVDGTGQVHQGHLALAADGQWRRLETGVPSGWGHWQGANDGVFHQPLSGLWLHLDKQQTRSPAGGTIWFDDVAVETTAMPPIAEVAPREARLRLNDLELTARPGSPEWGVWLLQTTLANRGAAPLEAALEVDPLYSAPWALPTRRAGSLTVAPGATAELVLPIPAPQARHLANDLRVTVSSGDTTASALASLRGAAAPAMPPGTPRPAAELPHNKLGVCIHLGEPNERLLRAVADAGLRWVRTDFMWQAFERERGQLRCPASIDAMVDQGRKLGLEWCCLLNGDNARCYPDDPYNAAAFARFAAFVADHFKGRITFFEILNEPIGQMGQHGYWQKFDGLVNAAAAAIKAARPDAAVLANTAYPHDTFTFVPRLAPMVDGVTLHPYPYQTIAEMGDVSGDPPYEHKDGTFVSEIECVREWLAAARCGKRVSLTEFGWPTYWPHGKLAGYEAVTPEAQAKYLPRRMIEALATGCDPVISYDIWDDFADAHHPEAHFGLVDLSGNRKPAWWSVARTCSFLGEASPWRPDFAVKPGFAMAGRTLRDAPRDLDAGVKAVTDALKLRDRAAALRYVLPPADVRRYWFRAPDGGPLLAVWQAVKVEGLAPFLGELELGTGAYREAIATDLYTGRSWALPLARHGETTTVQQVPAGDGPTIIQLHR